MKKKELIVLSAIIILGGFYFQKNNTPEAISRNDQKVNFQISPTDIEVETKKESTSRCGVSANSNHRCIEPKNSVLVGKVEADKKRLKNNSETYYIVDPETKTDLPLEEIRKRVKLSREEEEDLAKYIEKIDYNEEGKEAIRKIWLDMKASKIASRGVIHEEVMDGPMSDDPEYDSEEP